MKNNALTLPMTQEELASQKELQRKINERLDREKRERELYPNKQQEILYDCSLGMNKILESISVSALFKGDRRQTFDVFIINAMTLVRNCYDKKLNINNIFLNIKKDLDVLMRYIQLYFIEQKNGIEKPYVIVYLPIYNLPKNYLRQLSPDKLAISNIALQFFKKMCTNPPQISNMIDDCGLAYSILVGKNNLPHRELGQIITNKLDKGVMRILHRRYLLISHVYLDFHLQNILGNKLYILESYTGKIKTVQDLGEKIFKDPYVPFNQYTHLLLGDNTLIKPMVYRSEKKKVLEVAKANHWNNKPVTLILNDIRRLNIVPMTFLTFLKF